MNISTIILKKGEIIDTSLIFGDDEDFNGNNGEDFTSKMAIENGFASDLEYYTSMAIAEHGEDNKAIIEKVLKGFMKTNGYYYDMEIEFRDIQEGLLVVVATRVLD